MTTAASNISKPVLVRSFIMINAQTLPLPVLAWLPPSFIYEIPTYETKNYGSQWECDRSDQHSGRTVGSGIFHRQIQPDQADGVPGEKQAAKGEREGAEGEENFVGCRG